ncbi:hypothetical protein SAMN05444395_102390 [Flavobacterium fryxellicola]|uniref:Uncharacterized protein n=1 Tax=Flavobacterium fryxellicola TaxID=249352 RepID=A0A167Y0A8_9FLAO|nr:hypothetical protein [Flavobacterium fryxellicola]OAB28885.1 hypothetical protein FBFR_05345 [Flavobacterium fryxellicola]SHN60527.1 hypothetical protein SAMN05444395_102390 [Flavobacterium fryxellicola]
MLNIIAYIGYFILLLNLVVFIKTSSNQGKSYKIFILYLGVIFCVQIAGSILAYHKTNNLFLSHLYFVGQFIILSFFFLAVLTNERQKKIVKIGLIFGLAALAIQYSLNPSLLYKFNLFEIFITSFLVIVFATIHLYNMLGEAKLFYYITVGLLIYLFGSTALFLTGNLMGEMSSGVNKIIWILNVILYALYQLFILLEWKKNYYKRETNTIL